MNEITSVQNPAAKRLRSLKEKKFREASGQMLVEGEKLLREAVESGLGVHEVLIDREQAERFAPLAEEMRRAGGQVYLAGTHVLEAVCDTKTPQGVCAAFDLPGMIDLKNAPSRLIALDNVQDPGNVGTIWRTCDAAGLGGMLLAPRCADVFSPKVQRAAMGSGFRVGVWMGELPAALRALQAQGYRVVASSLHGEPFYEASLPAERFVLVIGNEARGVSDEVMELADVRLKLPMRGGAESLNAAVAAGIMMYELTRTLPGK
ncbi:MAG: RNA methyltransferase [Eubacteriales bacterium]|nr:RNA methyltransferase [bacterium]MDY2792177.1 RNA methyltransferase [Eubacteriales bacterium]